MDSGTIPVSNSFSDWANLPMHLLDSVSDRLLALLDYLKFSLVCKSWHRVAKDNQRRRQFPMLLISSEKEGTWNVYSVMEDTVLDVQIRLPNKRFCGSSKGWLATVEEDFSVTLYKSFSRVIGMQEKENSTVHLPPLEGPQLGRKLWVKKCDYYLYKTTISADPILDAEDCIVVVIYEEQCRPAFVRISKDKTWTYVNGPRLCHELVHSGNTCFTVDSFYNLCSFDITTQYSNSNVELLTPLVRKRKLQNVSIKRYLMDSNDEELMMVERNYVADESGKLVTKYFRIFKVLDESHDTWERIEHESIGDIALFVGDNSTASVLASSVSGCQPNYIYFTEDKNRRFKFRGDDFGVYNVKTKSISKPYTREAISLLLQTKLPSIWVLPTFRL